MDTQTYWKNVHTKYKTQDWIRKPTIFATEVIQYFPHNGRILELGCGQGQDGIYFSKQGYEVLSTDFSEFALGAAREVAKSEEIRNIEFRQVDMTKPLSFDKDSFDVIYSHLALHYYTIERTKELFDKIYSLLKPDGVFATLTNTIEDPEIPELEKVDENYYRTPEGLLKRYFSVESVLDLTKKFETVLADSNGRTYKDEIGTLIRYVGKKR